MKREEEEEKEQVKKAKEEVARRMAAAEHGKEQEEEEKEEEEKGSPNLFLIVLSWCAGCGQVLPLLSVAARRLCADAVPDPAVQGVRECEGPSDSIHRQSADLPVMPQRQVRTVSTCAEDRVDPTRAVFG